MCKKFISISIAVLVTCLACSSPGKEAARNAVGTFVDGLYARDTDSVLQVAPFFGDIAQSEKEQLYKNIATYNSWEIVAVQIKGSSAIISVKFSKPDSQVQMQFPLEAKNDSWVIQETISFSTTIDVIPAE